MIYSDARIAISIGTTGQRIAIGLFLELWRRKMSCPKCDQEMERQEYDPDVGVMSGGWFCTTCDVFIDESEIDLSDD